MNTNIININLLPRQNLSVTKQHKLSFIAKMSLASLILVLLLGGLTLVLRLTQGLQISNSQSLLNQAEAKVSGFKDKETQFLVLKQYLDSISQVSQSDIKRRAIFSLITSVSPDTITYTDITVSKGGDTTFSATTPDILSVDRLLVDLADETKNTGLIAKIDLEGLNLGKDNLYHFGFKLTPK